MRSMQRTLFAVALTLSFLLLSLPAKAATYYVRTDGSTSTNCLGTTDAAYDGSGTGEACAFNHPDWVMPMAADSTEDEGTKNSNGDTLVVKSGSYRMGCKDATDCVDANFNSNVGTCNTSASYDCDPRPLSNNVTVVGCSTSGCGCTYGWGGQVTCTTTRPELWGAGNVAEVIDVSGSSGVTIKDIEITDHANCNFFGGTFGGTWTCRHPTNGNSYPERLAAQFGINATGATNLTLTGVNNHGVGYEAMRVKNVDGLTITGSNIDYAVIGINNDDTGSCTTCGLSGTITIDKSSMNGHGCIEDWENDGSIVANTCCSQDQGCSSAESIGMANTGGDWILTDSDFSYNTADGIDLLYLNRGIYSGGSVVAKRIRSEGNSGNSIKGPNAMDVEDSFLLANCAFFQGLARTFDNATFNHCRANGHPISVEWKNADASTPHFYNNTISSNGDGVINIGGTCTTGSDFVAQGNVFLGGREWFNDSSNPNGSGSPSDDNTSIFYDATGEGGTCDADFVEDYNVFVGAFKEGDPHTGANSVYTATMSDVFSGTAKQGPYSSPGYFGSEDYNDVLYLKSGSTALGVSNEVGDDANDFNTFARGASWDAGAVEFGSSAGGSSSLLGVVISMGNKVLATGSLKLEF